MRRLEASLLENTSLASLTLKGNNLKWPHVELLFPALQKNRHLEYLDVGSNAFGDKAFASLTTALFHHPALHTLKASADNLGNDAMLYASLLLEFNPSLTSLFLCGLPPSPAPLCSLPPPPPHPIIVPFKDNKIGPIGAALLADALVKNSTLEELHLYGNELGVEGCKELALALAFPSSLKVLDLTSNTPQPRFSFFPCDSTPLFLLPSRKQPWGPGGWLHRGRLDQE